MKKEPGLLLDDMSKIHSQKDRITLHNLKVNGFIRRNADGKIQFVVRSNIVKTKGGK